MNREEEFLLGMEDSVPEAQFSNIFATYGWLAFLWATNRPQWELARGRLAIKKMCDSYLQALSLNSQRLNEVNGRIENNRRLYESIMAMQRIQLANHQLQYRHGAVARGADPMLFTPEDVKSWWTTKELEQIENMETLCTMHDLYVGQREVYLAANTHIRVNIAECVKVDTDLRTTSHFVDVAKILRDLNTEALTSMIEDYTSKTQDVFNKLEDDKGNLSDVQDDKVKRKIVARAAKVSSMTRTRVMSDLLDRAVATPPKAATPKAPPPKAATPQVKSAVSIMQMV